MNGEREIRSGRWEAACGDRQHPAGNRADRQRGVHPDVCRHQHLHGGKPEQPPARSQRFRHGRAAHPGADQKGIPGHGSGAGRRGHRPAGKQGQRPAAGGWRQGESIRLRHRVPPLRRHGQRGQRHLRQRGFGSGPHQRRAGGQPGAGGLLQKLRREAGEPGGLHRLRLHPRRGARRQIRRFPAGKRQGVLRHGGGDILPHRQRGRRPAHGHGGGGLQPGRGKPQPFGADPGRGGSAGAGEDPGLRKR